MKYPRQPGTAGIVLLVAISMAGTSLGDELTNFSIQGGNSGLKDVEGSKTIKEADGITYVLATGEDLASGSLKSGKAVIVSAATVKEVTEKSLTLIFDDKSIRIWEINQKTAVCDESGKAISPASLVVDKVVCVRWEIQDKQSLKLEKAGEALSVRKGPMRYKLREADGTVLDVAVLAECVCTSKENESKKQKEK